MARRRELIRANEVQADLLQAIYEFGFSTTGDEDSPTTHWEVVDKFKDMVEAMKAAVGEGLMELPKALGGVAIIAEAGAAVAGAYNRAQTREYLSAQQQIFTAASQGVLPPSESALGKEA